jgi:hypothetical protein
MAEEDPFEPVYTFFFAWFGFTLAVFPLVATVNSAAFGGTLSSLVVLVASVVVTIPAALEFLFSDREPRLVGKFVAVFVVLFFVTLVAQATVYVSLGRTESIPAVEIAVLFVTYVAAYLLVYRGGLARLQAAVTR